VVHWSDALKTHIGLLLLAFSAQAATAQEADGERTPPTVSGGVTVTNNGVSLLPTFTLDKPAAIFDLSVAGRRLSFEPQFRFALEGKPWSFIFWWRYELPTPERLSVTVGAHPAVLFKTIPAPTPGSADTIIAERYLAAELAPSYSLAEHIEIGAYYLFAHGLEREGVRNTHFVNVNASLTDLALMEQAFFELSPRIYYLRMDDLGGYYATATVSLHRRDFPFHVESLLNRAISTDIVADDFVWNVSLVYSF
jgi:hypothetical protein